MSEHASQNTQGTVEGKFEPVPILYTNWRGETAVRSVRPIRSTQTYVTFWFGSNEWHPEPQWLLSAIDVEKDVERCFAVAGIKAWGKEAVEAALAAPNPASVADVEELRRLSEAATKGSWHHVQAFQTVPAEWTIHGPVSGQRVDYVSTWPGLGTPPGHRGIIPMEGQECHVSSNDMAFIVASANYVRTHILANRSEAPDLHIEQSRAAADVLAERRRQVEAEGWTPEHDDGHEDGALADAAACYAAGSIPMAKITPDSLRYTPLWPWSASWFKPTTHRRNLIKAGALILAEIERLDRLESTPANPSERTGGPV